MENALSREIGAEVTKDTVTKEELTIVIPTWNEVQAIGQVIDELKEFGYENILVVDGYSTDGTPDVARSKGARVVNQAGSGKTGALATAAQIVGTRYMLVMDGDYTYDPASIRNLTAHARRYEEVIGARTTGRGNIPTVNRFGNRMLSAFFRIMFGVYLTDVCSGMYLVRTEALRGLQFTTGGFDVEVEIASQFADGGRVTEVPINYRSRVGTQKLSSVRHGITIALSILQLANLHNPVVLYSVFVALAGIPGLSLLAWVTYERIYSNYWHSGYALFGMMLVVIALQSLTVATMSILIKHSEMRTYRALRDRT